MNSGRQPKDTSKRLSSYRIFNALKEEDASGAMSHVVTIQQKKVSRKDLEKITHQSYLTLTDAESLAAQLILLMQNPEMRKELGERSMQVVAANRGALGKQMQLITEMS